METDIRFSTTIYLRSEMDFQVPQGTSMHLTINPGYLDKNIADFIVALREDDILTLTKGKLLIRMTFHQKAVQPSDPNPFATEPSYHAGGAKRAREEDQDSGNVIKQLSRGSKELIG